MCDIKVINIVKCKEKLSENTRTIRQQVSSKSSSTVGYICWLTVYTPVPNFDLALELLRSSLEPLLAEAEADAEADAVRDPNDWF